MDALEIGKEFEYDYALFYFPQNWKKIKIWEKVSSWLNPPLVLKVRPHPGDLASDFSFLSLPNLILSCLKPGQDQQSLILRFFEGYGQKKNLKFKFFKRPKKIFVCNLLEENQRFKRKIGPFEILTLKFLF
jgi:alpha-mannosidase